MFQDNTLFAGNSAPVLQPVWNLMRDRQDLLLSPIWTTSAAFLSHLFFSILFMFVDLLSPHIVWIQKYKISAETVGLRQWLYCLGRISIKYVVGVLPVAALVQVLRGNGLVDKDCLAPPLFRTFSECFSCLLMFDTLFFMAHYSAHRSPWLYRTFHRSHHQQREPFALSAQDSSVVELIVLQSLAIISPALLGCHPLSELLFHLVNMWLAVEDHCGYSAPWALHRLLPGSGGAAFHHAHHRSGRGNYAPYFQHWDLAFGTLLPAFAVCSETRGSSLY